MKSVKRVTYLLLIGGLFLASLLATHTGRLNAQATTRLVPIGASYQSSTLELFAEQAANYDTDGVVTIRVLPITYASDPYTISEEERLDNLDWATYRAGQVEDDCTYVVSDPVTCVATVVDIQVRDDADDPDRVALLDETVDGVFILGGDQQVAMHVVANTLAEDALDALYADGVPLGGTSAGAAVQSRYMIAGYVGDYWPYHGLQRDTIHLWYGSDDEVERGLRFGLEEAVIDQHVLQRGRIARLLQAAQRKPGARVGLGFDWGTGAVVEAEQVVQDVTGWFAAIVLDQEVYGAADRARYVGPDQILSIHDVAFHVLPEGSHGYDLDAHRPIVDGAVDMTVPDISARDFELLRAPAGAGPLFLAGDLSTDPEGEVTQAFARLAKAVNRAGFPAVVLAAGFEEVGDAVAAADTWAGHLANLGVSNVQTATLTDETDLDALADQLAVAGAIFVTGEDQVTMAYQVADLQAVDLDGLWRQGRALLLDRAAAAAAGSWMSAEPTPGSDLTYQSSDSFVYDYLYIEPGLDLIPGAVFEPRLLYDYLYGRLVSHIYHHPNVVGFGIQRGTAIAMTPRAARVLGEGAVLTIDGRYATLLDVGDNDVIAANWLLIDTFVPHERLWPPRGPWH